MMPTKPCPDCGKAISPRADVCPHCGCPVHGGAGQAPGGPGGDTGTTGPKSKTISQMGFSGTRLAFVTERVRNLSIQDLEDLASTFFNQNVTNPAVLALQAVDLKGLEDLFVDQRARTLQQIAGTVGPGGPVVGTDAPGGCCCSPCCCCTAAVEVDPFSESLTLA